MHMCTDQNIFICLKLRFYCPYLFLIFLGINIFSGNNNSTLKNGTEILCYKCHLIKNAYQIKTLNTELDKSYNMELLCLWNGCDFSKGVKFASVPDNWKKAVYSSLIQRKTPRINEKQ